MVEVDEVDIDIIFALDGVVGSCLLLFSRTVHFFFFFLPNSRSS